MISVCVIEDGRCTETPEQLSAGMMDFSLKQKWFYFHPHLLTFIMSSSFRFFLSTRLLLNTMDCKHTFSQWQRQWTLSLFFSTAFLCWINIIIIIYFALKRNLFLGPLKFALWHFDDDKAHLPYKSELQ